MASPVDREFQTWIDGKGELLSGFISSVRAICNPVSSALVYLFPADFKRYFVIVMRRMLERWAD